LPVGELPKSGIPSLQWFMSTSEGVINLWAMSRSLFPKIIFDDIGGLLTIMFAKAIHGAHILSGGHKSWKGHDHVKVKSRDFFFMDVHSHLLGY